MPLCFCSTSHCIVRLLVTRFGPSVITQGVVLSSIAQAHMKKILLLVSTSCKCFLEGSPTCSFHQLISSLTQAGLGHLLRSLLWSRLPSLLRCTLF